MGAGGYRRNFQLNRNTPGGGVSLELPGAHSDVGGGYRDPGDWVNMGPATRRMFTTRAKAEAAQAAARQADRSPAANTAAEAVFVREGFLNAREPTGGFVRDMTPVTETVVPTGGRYNPSMRRVFVYEKRLVPDRPWVQVGLSRVALHMMYDAAVAQVDGAFLPLPTTSDYIIPAALRPYVPAIRADSLAGNDRRFVLRNFGHVSMKDGAITSAEWLGHRAEDDHERTQHPNMPSRSR